jgi:hypothetical protein
MAFAETKSVRRESRNTWVFMGFCIKGSLQIYPNEPILPDFKDKGKYEDLGNYQGNYQPPFSEFIEGFDRFGL